MLLDLDELSAFITLSKKHIDFLKQNSGDELLIACFQFLLMVAEEDFDETLEEMYRSTVQQSIQQKNNPFVMIKTA